MSYLKLGWNWIRSAITQQWDIQGHRFLLGLPNPHSAIASQPQHDRSFDCKFTVITRFPASEFC